MDCYGREALDFGGTAETGTGDSENNWGTVMWEYLVVRLHINKPDHVEKTLNDWGRDGWELVNVCWQIGWSTAYFKRPKTLHDDEV